MAFEQIDLFFGLFYKFLFNTEEPVTVTEAFHQTLQSLRNNVQNMDLMIIPQLFTKFQQGSQLTLLFEKTPQVHVHHNHYH